jgi:hypothetical protein
MKTRSLLWLATHLGVAAFGAHLIVTPALTTSAAPARQVVASASPSAAVASLVGPQGTTQRNVRVVYVGQATGR